MSLKDFSLADARPADNAPVSKKDQRKIDFAHLDGLEQADLLTLREEVDKRLTDTDLQDVNVVKELLLSLKKAKYLQGDIEEDAGVPANQKAQVQNSLANIISAVAKLQVSVYNSERFKIVEKALVEALRSLPAPAQDKFFEIYKPLAERGLTDGLPQ